MTERQLVCFLNLARTLSFSETASQLHLTQPAVSQQIRSLEEYIGVPLFTRSKQGVSLTPAGVTFYSDAQDLLNQRRIMCQRARNNTNGYRSLITISCMMSLSRIPDILMQYHADHPDVLVSINPVEQNTINPFAFYSRSDVSIAFGNPSVDYGDFCFTTLYSGRFICALNRNHPLASKPLITLNDLSSEVIFSLEETLKDPMLHELHTLMVQKHTGSLMHAGRTFFDLASIAAAGIGVAVMPQLMQRFTDNCVFVPFDYPVTFYLGVFRRKDADENTVDFCRIAQSVCLPEDNIIQY